ncbi:MAG: hypothetical protein AAGI25_04290 [Bacteroidota bacterium]
MSLLNLFKLQKLKIFAYENENRIGLPKEFEAMFNPESVRRNFTNKFHKITDPNSLEGIVAFTGVIPSTIQMKLIFDGTGVDEFGATLVARLLKPRKSVAERVDEFRNLLVNKKGKVHRPMYLTIQWGKTLDYHCSLISLNINYTLFDRSGDPLRAELDVSFVGDDPPEESKKKAALQSPDLTHYRMVLEGDQLPLMCDQIYGSSLYYLMVAKANDLDDFRHLKPGQEIYFPPIEK